MRRTTFILLAFLSVLLAGCNKKDTNFTLKGNISELKSDTLLIYYQLPEYKLDTLFVKEGKVDYTFEPDTFTIFSLVFDSAKTYPIYADKGKTVELSGTPHQLKVKGEGDNQILANVLETLQDNGNVSRQKTDSIIKSNPHSFTSIYMIDKYYVNADSVDYEQLKELISGLNGAIKDTPYMMALQAKIENLSNRNRNRNIYSLQNKDKNGETIKWSSISDHYILIDFWASWDKKSIAAQDSLESVLKALKDEKFMVVSISLDMDRNAWLEAIADRDTTRWKQLCDFTGWNNRLVKDQGIRELPGNILLNAHKQIIDRDIRGQELIDKVKEMRQKDKEREKRESNRRKRNIKKI